MMRIVVVPFLLLSLISYKPAVADVQEQVVQCYRASGFDANVCNDSPIAACGVLFTTQWVNSSNSDYGAASINSGGNCESTRESCPHFASGIANCVANGFQLTTSTVTWPVTQTAELQPILHEHCTVSAGESTGEISSPGNLPPLVGQDCVNGCIVQIGSGASVGGSDWFYAPTSLGQDCQTPMTTDFDTKEYDPAAVPPTSTTTDLETGDVTVEEAPEAPPPAGADAPLTEEVLPNGTTIAIYANSTGDGNLVVVTDAGGNVTFAGTSPSGTGVGITYASGGNTTDGSTTDGNTTDGGTTDGDDPRLASGGATCAAEPSCSGDAIDCAILRQEWLARCSAEIPSDAEILSGTGLDGISTGDLNDGTVDLTGFDDSGFFTTRECPADTVVNVIGQSLSIPWTPFCSLAGFIAPLMLLAGALHSSKIVIAAL